MKLIRKIFSKKNNGEKEIGAGLALGVGGVVGSNALSKLAGEKLENSYITASDEKAINNILREKAKKQKIRIYDVDLKNSGYTGSSTGRKLRNVMSKIVKKLPREHRKDFLEGLDSGSGGTFKHTGKDHIILGNDNFKSADVLSHELGHAQYVKSGRSKNIIAKGAHKAMIPAKLATTKLGVGLSAVHGFNSGVKSEKAKQEGKKESKWNKVRAIAVPALVTTPLLVAEGSASLKGLKMMKQAGASKELLNQSKKRLGAAFGTYAGGALKPIVAGEAGRIVGKGYAKIKNKEKEKE